MISYAITSALNSGLFEEVMVSTDDNEIAEIAKAHGAQVPFKRSQENSSDFATTYDVIKEVVNWYKSKGREFDFVCTLYATSPLVTDVMLRDAFKKFSEQEVDGVLSVVKYGYPVQRSLKISEGKIALNFPEHLKARSQDLEDIYHDAGMLYFYRPEVYLAQGGVLKMNTAPFVVDEMHCQDIDTETDWKLAELKYSLIGEKRGNE